VLEAGGRFRNTQHTANPNLKLGGKLLELLKLILYSYMVKEKCDDTF
jgi:hypothetical protein